MGNVSFIGDFFSRRSGAIFDDYRAFERDSARVFHSKEFRILQSKMQFVPINSSDFFRTRLTHSLEVMQIGRGIVLELKTFKEKFSKEKEEIIDSLDTYLMEAICLSHDIGHPPFGHSGERVINEILLKESSYEIGFEGNAQSFRIMSNISGNDEYGLDLSRRAMLGIIKYPSLYSNGKKLQEKGSHKLVKGIYDIDKDAFDFALGEFDDRDRIEFQELEDGETIHKSFDTSIMDKADDIAYVCHDLEDAIYHHLLKPATIELIASSLKKIDKIDVDILDKALKRDMKSMSKLRSTLIHYFISNLDIRDKENFTHPLLKFELCFKDKAGEVLKEVKKILQKDLFNNSSLLTLEFKGANIIRRVFEAFLSEEKLLPFDIQEKIRADEKNRLRHISDFIASKSDESIANLYARFFESGSGKLSDFVQ